MLLKSPVTFPLHCVKPLHQTSKQLSFFQSLPRGLPAVAATLWKPFPLTLSLSEDYFRCLLILPFWTKEREGQREDEKI